VTLSGDFDTFLTLLTNQLQNQDPLAPVDTAQFTQQLVQFSQVEQQIQTNSLLESLIKGQATSAVNLLGTTAVFDSPVAQLGPGKPAVYDVTLPPGTTQAEAIVRDARNTVVTTIPLSPPYNTPQTVEFSGQLAGDRVAQPGAYRLEVRAQGADQKALNGAAAYGRETITGIDLSGTDPVYLTPAGPRSFDSIRSLVAP